MIDAISTTKELIISELKSQMGMDKGYTWNNAMETAIEIVEDTTPNMIAPSIPDIQGRSYCMMCGQTITDKFRYCFECGTKLKE